MSSKRPWLQWGRDLAVTETDGDEPQAGTLPGGFNGAVTLRSRKQFADACAAAEEGGFNGAVTLRSRKPVHPVGSARHRQASMGP